MERAKSELAQHWRIALGAFAGVGAGLASCFALLGLFTAGLTSFLALVLLLTVCSAGSNAIGYNRLIVRQFHPQRGLALGLALTGTAVGAALFPPLLGPLIEAHGWRAGDGLLSVNTVALTARALLLLRGPTVRRAPDSRQPNQRQTDRQPWRGIVKHPPFLHTSAMIFLSSIAVLGTTMHLVPFLADHGESPAIAGAIASTLGFSVVFGRIGAGYLLDRFDTGLMTFALLALASGGICSCGRRNLGCLYLERCSSASVLEQRATCLPTSLDGGSR